MLRAAQDLSDAVHGLRFGPPVAMVYNPLRYAWNGHKAYLEKYAAGPKRVLFLGMNPGPFGMAQTGVPFGEVSAVRDWIKIDAVIQSPPRQHKKRPILGFDCPRSEVSGRRLWGLFAQHFGTAESFFRKHFVANYCPLLFVEMSGCNRTPDKLPPGQLRPLQAVCDTHLRRITELLKPEWVIGIGRFAADRARIVFPSGPVKVGTILHPSPASPASNRDWAGTVTKQLQALRVWD